MCGEELAVSASDANRGKPVVDRGGLLFTKTSVASEGVAVAGLLCDKVALTDCEDCASRSPEELNESLDDCKAERVRETLTDRATVKDIVLLISPE